ncbi:hypothetical protein BDQ17DRAFT_1342198 [Cyathus striatus]|nr:hypothetical protein BDQ17DRAFT_1342198 [Cyathus striatus]
MDSDLSMQFGGNGDDDAETIHPVSRAVLMARILAPGSSRYSYNGSIATSSAPRATVVGISTTPRNAGDLHIKVGQSLRILVEYDDGWVLCANEEGYQGLVPISCLDIPQVG